MIVRRAAGNVSLPQCVGASPPPRHGPSCHDHHQTAGGVFWLGKTTLPGVHAAQLYGELSMSSFPKFLQNFGLLIAQLGLGGILQLHGWLR
jgi:hypothetical protein